MYLDWILNINLKLRWINRFVLPHSCRLPIATQIATWMEVFKGTLKQPRLKLQMMVLIMLLTTRWLSKHTTLTEKPIRFLIWHLMLLLLQKLNYGRKRWLQNQKCIILQMKIDKKMFPVLKQEKILQMLGEVVFKQSKLRIGLLKCGMMNLWIQVTILRNH